MAIFYYNSCENSEIFSRDGKYVLMDLSDDDEMIQLSDIDGNVLTTFRCDDSQVCIDSEHITLLYPVFSPDGKYVLRVSNDRVELCDRYGNEFFVFKPDSRVLSAVFSPDGKYVLTASSDKTAKLWDISAPSILPMYSDWLQTMGIK